MKIFFSTSPKTKDNYPKQITKIYSILKSLNHELTDTYIENITSKKFYSWNNRQKERYYNDTIKYIKKADVCIYETSYPSLGVGHLINQSLNSNKPVIVLYTNNKEPFMLNSANNDNIIIVNYNISNLQRELTGRLRSPS